ncbi:hypothetical protein V5799_021758 [Amblyomma americanum]|uniref:Uncharacterized protein n=1 Tax=Amblyomma americanum TaxID=6943 RepID=A0AAQ4FMY6_AMBAM
MIIVVNNLGRGTPEGSNEEQTENRPTEPSQKQPYQHPDTFIVEVCIVTTKDYRDFYTDYVEMASYFGAMINSVRPSYVFGELPVIIKHIILRAG